MSDNVTYQYAANHGDLQCGWDDAEQYGLQDECDPSTSRIQILIGDKSLDTTHFVPRSIALVKPPVCRDRWNLRSKLRRCSNVSRATLLTAFCPTLAKTAFSSSVKSVAPIRAAPSAREEEESLYIVTRGQLNKKRGRRTSKNERPRQDPHRRVLRNLHVQRVDNILKYQRHLHVEHLSKSLHF